MRIRQLSQSWRLKLLSVVIFFLLPTTVSAQKTVVVILHENHALAVRLAAELSSQSFKAELRQRPPLLGALAFQQIADSTGAVAVMEIEPGANSVLIWLRDDQNSNSVQQRVTVSEEIAGKEGMLTFKSVELLRAMLLILPKSKVAGKSRTVTTTKTPREAPRDTPQTSDYATSSHNAIPRLSLLLQPGITYGSSNLPPLLQIATGVHFRFIHRIKAALWGLVPTVPSSFKAPEGTVNMITGLMALGISSDVLPADRRLQLHLGIGGGFLLLKLTGDAAAPNVSKNVLLKIMTPYASLGSSIRLNHMVRIRLDFLFGWPVQRPVVRMLERTVSTWGRPMLTGMIGLEVCLF